MTASIRPHALATLMLSLSLVAACAHTISTPSDRVETSPSGQVAPPSPVSELPTDLPKQGATRKPLLLPGSGDLVGQSSPENPATPAADGFQLQFADADIGTVVSSILGDALNAPYTIDPGVKGTLTLQSSQPLSKPELLAALEAALNSQGLALLHSTSGYRVASLKDAQHVAPILRGPDSHEHAGYAVQIVPLQFVGAADMQKILEPFAPQGGILRVDESRNLLMLAGTGPEISSMLDVVHTFDVDWLAGMSFALFTLNYVDAKTLTGELANIFADAHSPLNGLVRLVPIPRLNAILVITPQKKYLNDVDGWIQRLDLGGSSPGRRIYVYDVQNTKAGDLAKSLNRILSLSTTDVDQTSTLAGSGFTSSNAGFGAGNGSGVLAVTPGTATTSSPSTRSSAADGAFSGATASHETIMDTGAIRIVPNDDNNSLLILASPSEFVTIEAALKHLDVAPRQVLLEATLAEVTLTKDLQYGVQWSYLTAHGPLVQSPDGTISQQFPGISYLFSSASGIKAVLNALESLTKVRVVSNPKLLVLNNREAQLQIGDQVPVATQSSVGTLTPNAPIVNSVQYRDTGVILHVTPRVNQSGLVQLDIDQEVSDVAPTTTSGINSPTINQRKISTTVSAYSGETIALGGLIRETVTRTKEGVPLLSSIPIVGALFGQHSDNVERTELVVLITPHVIRDEAELQRTMGDLRSEFKSLPEFHSTEGK